MYDVCVCVGGGLIHVCTVHVVSMCYFACLCLSTRMSFCMYFNMISCLCFGGWKEGETDN